MALPVIRRYTLAAPAALNAFNNLTDDLTGQAQWLILGSNVLQDLTNDPDPAAGLRYEFVLLKNGNQTPVRAFSSTISPTTQGRVPIGPVNLTAGHTFGQSTDRWCFNCTSIIADMQPTK